MTATKKFWGRDDFETHYPLKVTLPKPQFDAELRYHAALSELKSKGMTLNEVDHILNNVLESPADIDLSLLYEQKRASHMLPSEDDVKRVQDCVGRYQEDIENLEGNISGLMTELVRLGNELSSAASQLAQKLEQKKICEKILAPVNFIHEDILEPIFLACLDLNDNYDLHPLRAPLQLASVCYRWWKLAHSMPALWSYILIDPDHLTSSLNTAGLWIDRSRYASFRLHLKLQCQRNESPLSDFLHKLQSSSIRFKRLEIEIEHGEDVEPIVDLLWKDHSDELEDLKIRHSYVLTRPLPPSLKRLFLLYCPESMTFSPPPANLTILRIVMEIHWDMLEWCLFHCKNLQKVLVSLCETGTTLAPGLLPTSGTRPFVLKELIYLGITNDCNDTGLPNPLLSAFSFPSLQRFDYYADKETTASMSWFNSLPFLSQIRRLVLQIEFALSREMILSILRNTYALEEFSVYNTPGFHYLETLATILSTPDSLLIPQLKRFHIGSLHNRVVPLLELEPFVKAKPRVGAEPEEGTRMYGLSHLDIHHWHQEKGEDDVPEENQIRLALKASLQDMQTKTEIRMIRHILHDWVFNVPILFEMFPLSFNEERRFEVMQNDGSWKTQVGGIYSVE